MTMTRTEKAHHVATLAETTGGYVRVRFFRPDRMAAAIAERGHAFMTMDEYAEHLMGRRLMTPSRIDMRLDRLYGMRRAQRVATARILAGPGRRRARVARRVTGLIPGTKMPLSWRRHRTESRLTLRPIAQ